MFNSTAYIDLIAQLNVKQHGPIFSTEEAK